jgi:hypothetical protein
MKVLLQRYRPVYLLPLNIALKHNSNTQNFPNAACVTFHIYLVLMSFAVQTFVV